MRRSKFTEKRIVFALGQAEAGLGVPETPRSPPPIRRVPRYQVLQHGPGESRTIPVFRSLRRIQPVRPGDPGPG